MAQMTLATLITEVDLEIPGVETAAVVAGANKVIRRIQTEFVEPKRTTFTTRVATSSGTVSVTQDSTSVTFSGTPLAASDPLMLIQIDGDSTWILLTYASTSTGTLSSKWAESTNATATYQIVYPTASFPNTFGEILKVQRFGYDPLTFRIGGTCPWTVGLPVSWSPYAHDDATAAPSDDLTRIFLDPAPDTRVMYEAWYKPRTVRLDPAGATSQVVPLTDLWEEAIIQGVQYFCWKREADKTKALLANALYEAALNRARASAVPGGVIPRTRRNVQVFAVDARPITDG